MRLGFDGKRATQNFRGLGNYSRGIIEGLLGYSDEEVFLYSPPVNDERALAWLNRFSGPKLRLRTPEKALEKKIPSLWRSFSIINDLKNDQLDLYHGLSHEIPFGSNGAKYKNVVTIHDLIFLRYPEFFPLIDRMTYKQKFTYAGKNADLVIAICEQTKRDLIEFLGVDEKKIIVHYQSCDPVFYDQVSFDALKGMRDQHHIERPFILNVGAFEERKNQLTLIEAYAKVAHKVEQDLIFIGAGKSYLEKCKARVEELNLGRRVRFMSNVPFHLLPYFYQAADLFCFPSHFEGFGLPIVEALYSKTPVITSRGSCFPESGGPGTIYIDPLSVQELSDNIIQVLDDVKLQESMIVAGWDYVQQFHRENTTKTLLECYARLF